MDAVTALSALASLCVLVIAAQSLSAARTTRALVDAVVCREPKEAAAFAAIHAARAEKRAPEPTPDAPVMNGHPLFSPEYANDFPDRREPQG